MRPTTSCQSGARRQTGRLRERPLRQLRRVRHARRRRRGPPADVPLGCRVSVYLHPRRPGRGLRRRADGHRGEPPVSDGIPAGALPGARRRRAPDPVADNTRRGREVQPHGPVPALPRQEGRRESVAQAPHVGHHARRLGLRRQGRHAPEDHHVRGRRPQPRLHRRRQGLLLPERGVRHLQRPQDEHRGRQVAAGDVVQEAAGPLPQPVRHGHPLLRLRR